ncbi:hypothetical protein M405DRAFT_859244 [Rhizopogon salebrosus TDB-379]|nr:hypothetical protein M405DRAFT_859244 [Rhizopogon salebrosus TDB-379]
MMQPRAKFLSLGEEVQTNILSLLPYRDILRCASVSYNSPFNAPVTTWMAFHIEAVFTSSNSAVSSWSMSPATTLLVFRGAYNS